MEPPRSTHKNCVRGLPDQVSGILETAPAGIALWNARITLCAASQAAPPSRITSFATPDQMCTASVPRAKRHANHVAPKVTRSYIMLSYQQT